MAMNIRFHSIHLSINSAFTFFLAIHEERVLSFSLNTKANYSPSILIMVSISIRKYHYQKQHEEYMLTILMSYSTEGSQGSNSRPELKRENAAYRLVLPDLLILLSFTNQNYLPRDGMAQSQLGPPTSFIKKNSPSPDFPTVQTGSSNFWIEVPIFQMTLACI